VQTAHWRHRPDRPPPRHAPEWFRADEDLLAYRPRLGGISFGHRFGFALGGKKGQARDWLSVRERIFGTQRPPLQD
jgi:hypothetical protein